MKKLITILTLSILITGCLNVNKDQNSIVLPDKKEYISQRHLHENKMRDFNFKNEQEWDSLNNISNEKVLYKKGKVHHGVRTFGWHLYSNGSSWKNYNFPMLWGLSYFSYSIQPETGNYKSIHQWKTTALIDSAKVNNCKVFLSVSNFGSESNSIFLENSKAQATLIDSLSSLLALRAADGINIDFEGVSKKIKRILQNLLLKYQKDLSKLIQSIWFLFASMQKIGIIFSILKLLIHMWIFTL